ncbi:hypothetical protein Stsp02_06910 [Streptomyces sp. NBRC 14336]|uniref:LPXTG cell wall anchor domain-containing protein n=1 Tax=Streptomyces sp. NBRC 14336 TaxID=3030992 RepID=UPI0024A3E58A|nr:LPXTG cell wall anchor domain-containing protein [Streptomyces sp. NBRC 14336]WBO79871.1 LPXTG cell wall anchor domain-containing protein [Streptomyces sp. SBE_14.2]GLW45029.1 hypothetical protein Stsp02_06910 [Streptomyces sp. NBRC 14336]
MKLRRALAVAAATAALAPVALMSAPAAFATDGTSAAPSAVESTPASEESSPETEETTPEATETTGPAPEETEAAPTTTAPSTEETAPAPAESSPAATESSPAPSESTPAEDEEEGEGCLIDEDGAPIWDISDVLHSSLTGLPESIVAGSGWTDFTFNVSNSGDETIENIVPVVGVAALDWELEEDYSDLVTVQVRSGGTWVDLATEFGEGSSLNAFALEGGQAISYDLRVKVDREVPSAVGIAVGLAEYFTEDGCWTSEDENFGIYFFEVLPAGSKPGKPNDSKPQTGGKDEITEVDEVDVDGELAETGADSGLPVLATVGGVAILAGTGVLFAMRRRKAGAAA